MKRLTDSCACGQPKDTRAKKCRACYKGSKTPDEAANRLGHMKANLRWLAKQYGLDPDEVEQAWLAHNGLCDCCGQPPPTLKRLCIEHQHDPPRFRGFVCDNCNLMLGHAQDDPERLLAGVAYLRR